MAAPSATSSVIPTISSFTPQSHCLHGQSSMGRHFNGWETMSLPKPWPNTSTENRIRPRSTGCKANSVAVSSATALLALPLHLERLLPFDHGCPVTFRVDPHLLPGSSLRLLQFFEHSKVSTVRPQENIAR